uniref:Uncharacterized protein n=1 Tax=Rousettus aegyptiacus TaxID=9407 RepID=A0A7J8EK71_ROUAE|nr:hypothetical protein HJG63_012543 [Rousettus aegyptiacus]
MKLDCSLSPHTKINSKWITDLNIRPETINLIEENIGTKLMDLELREDFMQVTSKAREVKAKTSDWDSIKLKIFSAQQKEPSRRHRGSHHIVRRYLQTMPLIRALYSKYTKNSYNSTLKNKQTTTTIRLKNWQRT